MRDLRTPRRPRRPRRPREGTRGALRTPRGEYGDGKRARNRPSPAVIEPRHDHTTTYPPEVPATRLSRDAPAHQSSASATPHSGGAIADVRGRRCVALAGSTTSPTRPQQTRARAGRTLHTRRVRRPGRRRVVLRRRRRTRGRARPGNDTIEGRATDIVYRPIRAPRTRKRCPHVTSARRRRVGFGRAYAWSRRRVRTREGRSRAGRAVGAPTPDERGAASLAEPAEVVLDVVTRDALHGEVTRAGRDDARHVSVQAPHLSAREPGDVLANAHERVRGGAGVRERHGDAGETTDAGGSRSRRGIARRGRRGARGGSDGRSSRWMLRWTARRRETRARSEARRGRDPGRPLLVGASVASRRPRARGADTGATTRPSRLFSDEATFEI